MKKNSLSSIGSNSTPEEINAFLEHQGLTPEDMQRMLNSMFGGRFRNQIQLPGMPAVELEETPFDQALDLIDEARRETKAPKKQRALLKKALQICPECADAYMMLASLTTTAEEKLKLLRQAVAAGERFAGKEAFTQDVGHFWGILETRPYMRALHRLGEALWHSGDQQEAIAHYQDMLRLNPGDNQGIRYTLLAWLIELGQDQEASALLAQYAGDAFAAWPYSKALLSFRAEGSTKKSQTLLKKAKKENPYIFEYLSTPSRLPEDLPDHYALGSEEEALVYLNDHLAVWKATPGALEWVHQAWLGKANLHQPVDVNDARTQTLLAMLQGFCRQHLDEDYEYLCAKMVMKLARKRQLIYASGKLESWAAAIVCTIGSLNFLYDKSFKPYMKQEDICKAFGVSSSNVSAKTSQIRSACNLPSHSFFNEEFATKTMKDDNPLRKLEMSMNGLIIPKE